VSTKCQSTKCQSAKWFSTKRQGAIITLSQAGYFMALPFFIKFI
jgi:hypothetical protein